MHGRENEHRAFDGKTIEMLYGMAHPRAHHSNAIERRVGGEGLEGGNGMGVRRLRNKNQKNKKLSNFFFVMIKNVNVSIILIMPLCLSRSSVVSIHNSICVIGRSLRSDTFVRQLRPHLRVWPKLPWSPIQ